MLFDSFVWLEIIRGTPAGRKASAIVDSETTIFTTPIVLAEVFSRVARTSGAEVASLKIDRIAARCAMIPADESIGRLAGAIHAERKQVVRDFGLADAFIVAAARSHGVRVLTGDPHILAMPEGQAL